jgi:peptidoglycan/LPS O-acetylase OafA/YrhL
MPGTRQIGSVLLYRRETGERPAMTTGGNQANPVGGRPIGHDGQRLIGLELLRFAAAIGVLVWHYQHFMFVGLDQTAWDWNRLPFRWVFAPFYRYGYDGVELFWCISGFIFTWKYGALISRTGLSFGRFAMLRFSRLYPLHLATLMAVAALQWLYFARNGQPFVYLFNDTTHFVMNLFFANWWGFQSGESFNGPSWSISAEVLIYAAFFWITRLAGPGWRTDLLALAGFSVAAQVAKALFGIKLAFTGAGTFFFLGALCCHLNNRIETLGARWRHRIAWGCVGLIAVCAILLVTRVLAMAGSSLALFPAAVLLVQLAVRPESHRIKAWLVGLGNLTYASYMLHFPIQLTAMLVLGALSIPVQPLVYSNWFMLAYLGTVLAAAFMVFRWVERPAQAFLRGLGQHPRTRIRGDHAAR